MNLQTVLNSRLGVGTALFLGRMMPPRIAYPLANFAADKISARRHTALVKAIRANQWVAAGEKLDSQQLDERVQATVRATAHCLYDLYHYMRDSQAASRLIHYEPNAEAVIQHSREKREGQVIAMVHTSNFDFIGQVASTWGLQALGITLPEIGKGYQWQNDMRKKVGMDIRPASVAVLREAVRHLKSGGTVMTGMDRPLSESKYKVMFFGRPAALPVIHIQLALLAKVPVLVAAVLMQPDGTYEISLSEPICMQPEKDRHAELVHNAERVLSVGAQVIRQAPHQWAMFYPVWPEVQEFMP